jgi:acyl-CoA synthetase (NDP forming)
MDVAKRVHAYGLGVSRAASIGNQADVTIAELVTSMADHDGTDVIAIYCEDVRDGQALFTAIEGAVASGTPVVILAPGASASASRAARSHTGAMLSDRRIIEAACRAAGAVLATSIREVAEAAQAVRSPLRGRGDRVAVVSDAGGFTVLGAVAANGEGLAVPVFSAALEERLAQLSLPGAGLKNPVDIVGLVTFDEFLPVLELILDSDEVDGVLANISAFNSTTPEREHMLGARLADAAHASGKPLVVATPDGDLPGSQALRDRRIPVYPDIDVACRALRIACGGPPAGLPPARAASHLPADTDTYFGARRLLAEHALEFPPAEEVTDLPGARAAAERVGYPVVLKALGTLHKSDEGGVAVGLADQAALEEAFADMGGRLQPPSCSVERSVDLSGGTEVIVGGRNDPRFGPVVLVGIGGVFAEVLADTAVALAPVDARHARSLIARLKGVALLTGARGRPAADLDALAAAIVSVSEVVATQPAIAELDVNPLIALPSGVLALDARIVRHA